MAHHRDRQLIHQIKKKAKLWPVIGLLGPRQSGKSTMLREICGPDRYINLDYKQLRDEAIKSPDFFIASHREKSGLVAIDEVQKAPELFDAIKASIDESRRPGVFILAGSTQFSTKVGIRESLTGRIGTMRVWPMTLGEACQHEQRNDAIIHRKPKITSTPAEVIRRMEFGGMPGFCFVRSGSERDALIEAWLETTCYRDMEQILGLNVRGEKVLQALRKIATDPELTHSELAKHISVSTPTARKILEGLETLMVINRVPAHRSGVGKGLWLICDSALAKYLGSSPRLIAQVVLHQEILCQYAFAGEPTPQLFYYKTRRGSFVDFILEDKRGTLAILVVDTVAPKPYELRAITALNEKLQCRSWVVGPFSVTAKRILKSSDDLIFVPWTAVL